MPPKKDKDPNKPKGRTSAYAFFLQDRRNEYRQQGKDVDFKDFSRECASMWKEAGEQKKKKFFDKAEIDRRRYVGEMKTYVPPDDGTGKKGKRGRRKRPKDPLQPKRAMSAFFWFAQDKRPKLKEQNPGATVGEIAKQLGAAWKIMTKEQKDPYEQSAKTDRSRYDTLMAAYKKGEKPPAAVVAEADDDEEDEEYSDED